LSAFRDFVRQRIGENGIKEMMRKWSELGMLSFQCASFLAVTVAFGQAQKPASKAYVLEAARMFDGKSDTLVKSGSW
jgi:hypothetical protein